MTVANTVTYCTTSPFEDEFCRVLIFTLKMATATFSETLDNFQHSTRLIPESRSCTLNSSREKLRTRRFSY
jgi:hypothetical protein